MARLAVLSYHTSPLAQPGTGDGGGMNVYVRELATALARLGHDVDVYTRRDDPGVADRVVLEPGFSVRYVTAGLPEPILREDLPKFVGAFTDAVADDFVQRGAPDAIHANYWLSGIAGHRLKHEFSVPLVCTFHTLEAIKATAVPLESAARLREERTIIGCSDAVLASCDDEAAQIAAHYDADPTRVHVVPLGVEHAFFGPGYRPQARRALGLAAASPLLLFVGRLQELKGAPLALEATLELRARGMDAHLAVVGGPSGPGGTEFVNQLHRRVERVGAHAAVSFVAPQPHELLSTWFRAADVTLVPSLSESFGLVALESSACGTPVVASRVGGLPSLINEGVTGLTVAERSPAAWADAVTWVVDDVRATTLSTNAVLRAREYTWRAAARTVEALCARLAEGQLVSCP
jgi:D-inositol-3-phosphate glycosyltransferase